MKFTIMTVLIMKKKFTLACVHRKLLFIYFGPVFFLTVLLYILVSIFVLQNHWVIDISTKL